MSFFGKNIRKIRSIRKISQTEFANIFDISRASVGSYEEGRAEPKLEIISNVAKYFSITIDELINKELTVNDLYHFDVGSEPMFKKDTNKAIELVNIPLYTSDQLNELNSPIEKKKAHSSITIPYNTQNDQLIAVLIANNYIKHKPNNIQNNQTIILRNESKTTIDNNTYYFIKTKDAIYISKLILLANQTIYLSQVTTTILILDRKEIELCLPIVNYIGSVPDKHTNERLNQIENQLNNLIIKTHS